MDSWHINENKKTITRRGSIHILELTDDTSSIEISIHSDYFEEVKHKLKLDEYFQVLVQVREDEYSGGTKLNVKEVLDAISVRERNLKFIKINIPPNLLEEHSLDKCINTISDFFTLIIKIRHPSNSWDALEEFVVIFDGKKMASFSVRKYN